MTSYIPAELRRLVTSRANGLCEYCLIHEADTFLGCQVDHIISEKHRGATIEANLCLACTFCNRSKGTDIGSIARSTGEFSQFYNPRTDDWSDHFRLNGALIGPRTPMGETTVAVLGLNHRDRVLERQMLLNIGAYPSAAALRQIRQGGA